MKMTGKLTFLPVAIFWLAVAVGFCQNDNMKAAEESASLTGETEPGAEPETDADMLLTARQYGSLTIFLRLLEEAEMIDILKNEKELTLFAPDDSAFQSLAETELNKLKEDKNKFRQFLSRHLVIGQTLQFKESETLQAVTQSRDTLLITATSEKVTVNDALVIDEEIWCDNGVIHVVKEIISPLKKED